VKIRIRDREYQQVTRSTAHALHLIELRAHSLALVDEGLIPEPLGMAGLSRLERAVKAYIAADKAWRARVEAGELGQDSDPPDQPDEGLILTGVTVFLTRRKAGEVVGLRECLDVCDDDLAEVPEATDPPERAGGESDADTTSPGSAGPVTPGSDVPQTPPTNGHSTI
jgi:hypothetical protein